MALDNHLDAVEWIVPDKIVRLQFATRNQMGRTFMRPQEHHESPNFRGKIFTVEEFAAWYIADAGIGDQKGEFDYADSVSGFNIPSSTLAPFYDGTFPEITPEEQELLDFFKERFDGGKPFYILASYDRGMSTKIEDTDPELAIGDNMHEIAHGLFTTDPGYRAKILDILLKDDELVRKHEQDPENPDVIEYLREEFPSFTAFFDKVNVYHPAAWVDEVNSYLLERSRKTHHKYKLDFSAHEDTRAQLWEVFKEHLDPERPDLIEAFEASEDVHAYIKGPPIQGVPRELLLRTARDFEYASRNDLPPVRDGGATSYDQAQHTMRQAFEVWSELPDTHPIRMMSSVGAVQLGFQKLQEAGFDLDKRADNTRHDLYRDAI